MHTNRHLFPSLRPLPLVHGLQCMHLICIKDSYFFTAPVSPVIRNNPLLNLCASISWTPAQGPRCGHPRQSLTGLIRLPFTSRESLPRSFVPVRHFTALHLFVKITKCFQTGTVISDFFRKFDFCLVLSLSIPTLLMMETFSPGCSPVLHGSTSSVASH